MSASAAALSFSTATFSVAPRTNRAIFGFEVRTAIEQGAVLVDIRTQAERAAQGILPGAIAVDRASVWLRLDPDSAAPLGVAIDRQMRWLVVCANGDDSAKVVDSLYRRGLPAAQNVVGGFAALRVAGLVSVAQDAPHFAQVAEAVIAH